MSIAVAVSGGMDSLLALVLLKERGLDPIGLHAYFLPPDKTRRAVARDLASICDSLDVDFVAVDVSLEFRDRVVEPFAREYASGLTPNPCALCNAHMKFGLLMDKARDLGADRLATGHYAALRDDPDLGRVLSRGADPAKDQSYFLALVPRARLAYAAFPLNARHKKDMPAELAARGLATPLPRESQEICFVPGDDYCAFLKSGLLKEMGIELPGPGPIMLKLEDGTLNEIGGHQGLWRHTQGQRRGLGVSWSEPLYILAKDIARNALIVGPKQSLQTREIKAGSLNIMVPPTLWPDQVMVQTRYRQEAVPATAKIGHGSMAIHFSKPVTVPAPGQVAAVYDRQGAVLAGGVIKG